MKKQDTTFKKSLKNQIRKEFENTRLNYAMING